MFGKIRSSISKRSKNSSVDSESLTQRLNSLSLNQPSSPRSSQNPYRSSKDAPPPYTAVPEPASVARSSSTSRPFVTETADDKFAFLKTFDTVFLIDDSGSMAGSRWRDTETALKDITPICTAHDADGIDIYFLNHPDEPRFKNVRRTKTIEDIFTGPNHIRPRGATFLGMKLRSILTSYLHEYARNKSMKPLNIICVTDGEPTDDPETELIHAAKKLDKLDAPAWQVGIQFFQVGNDPQASKYLQTLDDELAEISKTPDLRDIVDTVPFSKNGGQLTADGILKVVLGAVNRRLDRKKVDNIHQ